MIAPRSVSALALCITSSASLAPAQVMDHSDALGVCGIRAFAFEVADVDLAQTERLAEVLTARFPEPAVFGLIPRAQAIAIAPGRIEVTYATQEPVDVDALIAPGSALSIHRVIEDRDGPEAAASELVLEQEGRWVALQADPLIPVLTLEDISVTSDQVGEPALAFRMAPDAAEAFGLVTTALVGERIGIVMDGALMTTPYIQSPIYGGSGLMPGSMTIEEAEDIAALLRRGYLEHPLVLVQEDSAGPWPDADPADCPFGPLQTEE